MRGQVRKFRVKKILAYSVTGFLFLLLSAFLILQIPPVQNWLASRYLKGFSTVTGFPATVEDFRMIWFDRLEVTGVDIMDPSGHSMIHVGRLVVNFRLRNLLTNGDLSVDGIVADDAIVNVHKLDCDSVTQLNINEWIARIQKAYPASKDSVAQRTMRVQIGEALINNSTFRYNDCSRDSLPGQFDYHHFTLQVDEGQLKNFFVLGDTTEFSVRTLVAQDSATKLKVHQLATRFHISRKEMYFHNLDAFVGKSIFQDSLEFYFEEPADLADFFNKVTIKARVDSTLLNPEDLALFAPELKQFRRPITFAGTLDGRVSNFKIKDFTIRTGQSLLTGDCDLEGLPNIQETFIILNLRNSTLHPNDLDFVLTESSLKRARPIGKVLLEGQFLGYPNDFVANGTFQSGIGLIKSDINFKIDPVNPALSEYKGKLQLTGFNLGYYLDDTVTFQQVDMNGDLEGKGLTLETADFRLNGSIENLGILGYTYRHIVTNARFSFGYIDGLVRVNDPNLEFNAEGSLDLRDNRNRIRIRGRLDTARLEQLGLSADPLFIRTDLNMDFTGIDLDKISGFVDFQNTKIQLREEQLSLRELKLLAINNPSERRIQLTSEYINGKIVGKFQFSDLISDLQTLSKELMLSVRNDAHELDTYYKNKKYQPKSYQAQVDAVVNDIRPVSGLFGLDLDITPDTRLEGRFTSGFTTIFNAYTEVDSIWFNGQYYLNTVAELTASKIADSTNILAMATLTSDKQYLTNGLTLHGLVAEAIWDRNHINFSAEGRQLNTSNSAMIRGNVDFLRDSTLIRFEPSAIRILERTWNFQQGNFISQSGSNWNFYRVGLENESQGVSLQGKIGKDPTKILKIKASNLDLALLDVITDLKFQGLLNAEVDISNLYKSAYIQNNISIDSLSINGFEVGNISGRNTWDTARQNFDVNIFVERNSHKFVTVTGTYSPGKDENQLDLLASFRQADIRTAEPFLTGIFSKLRGDLSGDYTISGNLSAPEIQGEGLLTNGHIMIDYLKTSYRVTGKIGMTKDEVYFKDFELQDALRNRGTLQGKIRHKSFTNMNLDLNGQFKNLQVLNTSAKDNSLFYGQAYSTGNLHIYGPFDNLGFDINAKSDKGTRFYIPISSSSAPERREFITFVPFRNAGKVVTKRANTNKVNLSGITMNLNLQITTDAYCEIIFDIKAGDIIRGRGNGDLKLQLDTKGEFSMFGPFEFTQGWYNFTLYELINKEFEIQKGSRITWYGDPYQATLDINASYNQLASFSPILNETDPAVLNSPGLRRKYPAQVLLMLKGPMLSPEINFDIVAKDLPKNIQTDSRTVNLELAFVAFKNKLDEQELKRQVFSLIVLRKFLSPESFNTSGSVMGSVSELLSNQLSYWMSQVDQNLEIDVDLGNMDQEAFNTFQLRFSYTAFGGRLRITGDGTFNNAGNQTNTQTPPSTVAGDWVVDYMLTADGKLRMKMYSRTNYNPILASLNNQTAITTGASIIHTQSFEQLKDLFHRARNKTVPSDETTPVTP